MTNKKYSYWIRFDLHIHTDLSKQTKENDYKGLFSVDVLKAKLKENQVEIFSLTDHNIINLPAYIEYYDKYTAGDPLLLLGVELDIVVRFETVDRDYHSLLIFNIDNSEKAKAISEKLEKEYKEKCITDQKLRKLTIDEIVKIFPEEDFFFVPHAGNTKSIVDAHQGNIEDAQKMVLLMQSALEKVPEKRKYEYNNGFNNLLHTAFRNMNNVAYIECSDNHNIHKYPCKHKGDSGNHEFYYIKGNKSYETLRLAFIDPWSRIKSTLQYNEIDRNINYIEGLKIKDHLSMCEKELSFSPHLNVLIGGRSSGKSLLMYLLGEKIDKVKTDRESFYSKVADKDKVLIKTSRNNDYNSKATISSEPIYINQGDIVRFFEEKKLKDLAKKSSKEDEYNESLKVFDANVISFKTIIQEVIESYEKAHNAENDKYIFHKSDIEHYFNDKYIVVLKKEEIQEVFDNSSEITDLVQNIDDIGVLLEKLEKSEILKFSKNEDLLIKDFKKLIGRKKEELHQIDSKTTKKSKFLDAADFIIDSINQKQDDDARKKKLARKFLEEMVGNIGSKLLTMKRMKESCDKIEKHSYSLSKSIALNEGISLVLEVEEKENLKITIIDGLNQANKERSLFWNFVKLLKNKDGIKNHNNNSADFLKKKVSSKLENILELMSNPKDYLRYSETESSKNKSPGFNSEKYLEIVLKNTTNNMIFIDQPEDNLGTKFITSTLLKIIRDIKFKKQIFLVTHNPSIVVYGDAESITIAENNDNKISYKQMVLEDKEAQKEICGILDGGEHIFNDRSRKYNIRRILIEGGQQSD